MQETSRIAYEAMAELVDSKQWDKVRELGTAWRDARDGLPNLGWLWLSKANLAFGDYDLALQDVQMACLSVEKRPLHEQYACWAGLAECLSKLGEFRKAKRVLKSAMRLKSDDPLVKVAQGHAVLAITERWDDGWALHEARDQVPSAGYPDECPKWNGESGEVAILHDQGYGDGIMVMGIWPYLAERFPDTRFVWYGPEVLKPYLRGMKGIEIGGEPTEMLTRCQHSVRAMSIWHRLGVSSPTMAKRYPVMAPSWVSHLRNTTAGGRAALRKATGVVKVGVCWKGNPHGFHDHERSLHGEVEQFFLSELPQCEFVSLQHDDKDGLLPYVKFKDYGETATRLAAECDLMLTVDTSVAHVAGAMGVSTVVLTPTTPDWRYADWPSGTSCVFYPSMRVVRRRSARPDDVMQQVAIARGMVASVADQLIRGHE